MMSHRRHGRTAIRPALARLSPSAQVSGVQAILAEASALRAALPPFAAEVRRFHDQVWLFYTHLPRGADKDAFGRYTNFTEVIIENLRENVARPLGVIIPGS